MNNKLSTESSPIYHKKGMRDLSWAKAERWALAPVLKQITQGLIIEL
jgi:hypothetical protein